MTGRQADIIIIGGGVIGLSIAYFTAVQGASVILVEKNRIPTGSSYGNAGLIAPSHCDPLPAPGIIAEGIRQIFDPSGAFSIRFRPDPALALWLLKFSRFCNETHFLRAVEIFKHLCQESSQLRADFALKGGSHYEYEQSGLLHLFASHEVFRESHEMAEKMANYGIEFSALSGDEVRELDPSIGTEVVGAIRHTTDARLYPPAFLAWLAKEAIQKGAQIASLRKRLQLNLVQEPIEIAPALVEQIGYPVLRRCLVQQFAGLTTDERLLWLNNFLFILTPNLRELNDKIEKVRQYRSFGQQRNFLLGGESGMGKTTYLNWLTANLTPTVETDHNRCPSSKSMRQKVASIPPDRSSNG